MGGLSRPAATPTTPTTDAVIVAFAATVIYYPTPPALTATPVVATTAPSPTPLPPPTDTPQPTVTPMPTVTPAPPTPSPPPPSPTTENLGAVTLLEPQHNLILPAQVRDFEFKWRWSGSANCQGLPPGYMFELRIWPARAGFGPLPAMDALQEQAAVACDLLSGVYHYRVDNLKKIAGTQAVAVETAATGPFNWDVAILRIYPDITPVVVSEPRIFTIPDTYVGPYDTSRPTATCLNFSEWLEAQALFLATGGPGTDLNGLDPDGNGIACDELRH